MLLRLVVAAALLLAAASAARAQCPGSTVPCGTTHCAPADQVCCASVGHPELSCPMGSFCQADGTCGSMQGCASGQALTVATCGGDTCSCSAPCARHEDCASGCCTTAGYCAPACVCQNTGKLYLQCQTGGTGAEGLPRSGGSCSAAPGAPVAGVGPLLFLLLLLAARRRAC